MRDSGLDVAVVGGGAAGLATAIFAAQAHPGLRIAVLDGAVSLGAKILVSGGGRCNVTNRRVDARDFNGGDPRAIARVLRAFPVPETIAFFAALGVPLHEEPRGKLFPDSNRARAVLDALLGDCRHREVRLLTGHRVSAIEAAADGFALATPTGLLHARRVVLATGGQSLPRTGSDGHGYTLARALGHSIVPTTPALVPLLLDGALQEGLSGVSHEARVVVEAPGARRRAFAGPLIWTHLGVSGPAVLDASRHWLRHRLEGRPPRLLLQATATTFEEVDAWLLDMAGARPRATAAGVLAGKLPASVAQRLADLAGAAASPLAQLSREARRALAHALSALPLPVRDSRGYDHAEATAGGVALDEIDPATLQSRRCAGLFVVGEVLDVDGRLGGFNFQWAWASGRVAGRAVAASLS
jgi:predicted Rossmann fold flavoprotein